MIGREAIAILPAAPVRLRNASLEYAYRQDSHFLYMTGFPEPEAVAVLVPGRPQGEYLLFVRERDAAEESVDGPRAGTEGAVACHAADDAFPIDDIDDILPGLLESRPRVFYALGQNEEFDPRVLGWVNGLRAHARQGRPAAQELVALTPLLDDMRLYKSRSEQASMRRSATIAVGAHRRAMRFVRPGRMEYEVAAEVVHEFHRHNAELAYAPIVGGGANACVMHYRANDQMLRDGELLLLDAGCEHESYASDITRTFPIGGRFTPAQRAVYEVVLEAQLQAIDKVRVGNDWNEPHATAVRALTQGLCKLGLLKGRPAQLVRDRAYLEFFKHRTGHWLGLDVHDVGDYQVGGEWRLLEAGMALTVEPGIYIRPSAKVAKEFWNIGVRIEDDLLVTAGDPEVLSGTLEKEPDAIERLVQGA
jgi:Xaa-Pro aminopeptidase